LFIKNIDSRTGFSEDARVIVQLEFVLRKVNTDVLGIYKDMGSPDKYNSIVMEFNTDMTPFISEHLPRARGNLLLTNILC
jgi:hypothetical protein